MTPVFDNVVKGLVMALKAAMEDLRDDDRIAVLGEIMEGYCRECGGDNFGRMCYCTNDE